MTASQAAAALEDDWMALGTIGWLPAIRSGWPVFRVLQLLNGKLSEAQEVFESAQRMLEHISMSPSQVKDGFCHVRHLCGNSFINLVPTEKHSSLPRRKSILSFTGFFAADDNGSSKSMGVVKEDATVGPTTVMLQNLPRPCTRKRLMASLDEAGFAGTYNFCHVPAEYATGICLGYAFINFKTSELAEACLNKLNGSEMLFIKKHRKPMTAIWAHTQGFDAMCHMAKKQCRARKADLRPFIA